MIKKFLLGGLVLGIGIALGGVNTTYAVQSCSECRVDQTCVETPGATPGTKNISCIDKITTPTQEVGDNIANYKAGQEMKAACGSSTPNVEQSAYPECAKAYSCESLFNTDVTKATECNYQRCLTGRGESYCACKYGEKGDGKNTGIPLNTPIPFIGSCVQKAPGGDTTSVFPTILSALTRLLVTIILLVGVIMVIIGGIQFASGSKKGIDVIKKVAIGFALLGSMSVILRLLNPNFFK